MAKLIYLKRLIAERFRDMIASSVPGYVCETCTRWFPRDYVHHCEPRPFPWDVRSE